MLIQINTYTVVMVLDLIPIHIILYLTVALLQILLFLELIWRPIQAPTQGLNHTLTAETQYSINFTRSGIKFCLSLHHNGSKRFWNKKYPLCVGNISKDFTANNMKKNQDYNIIDTSNIINIDKYLIKRYDIK